MTDEILDTGTSISEGQVPEQVATGDTAQGTQQTEQTQTQQEKMFRQADVDAIIAKRLEREKHSFESEKTSITQVARDSWIAEQGYEWHGKPIKTEAEYKEALKEQELETKIRSQYSNVPDEIVNEMLENRKFREESQVEKQVRQKQEAKQKDYQDFIEWYTKAYKVEPDPKTIPAEVWQAVKQGSSIKAAYMEYAINGYLTKEQQAKLAEQTLQANEKNALTSTGSVKSAGAAGGDYISLETFEANRSNQDWVNKNFDKINKSRAKW